MQKKMLTHKKHIVYQNKNFLIEATEEAKNLYKVFIPKQYLYLQLNKTF